MGMWKVGARMKIESRVILTKEELETINNAWEILTDFRDESIRVSDPLENLRTTAEQASNAVDMFLCAYSEIYEKEK